MTNILSFIIAAYLFFLSTAVGIKLTKALKIDSQRMIYSAAIGMGVLSHVVFLFGLVGLYYRTAAIALIVLISLFTWKEIVFKNKPGKCTIVGNATLYRRIST